MKMIVGSTWKAKIRTWSLRAFSPNVVAITCPHTGRSPSGPKTNAEPTSANVSSFVTAPPSVSKTRWPTVVLSTISANIELQRHAPPDGAPVDGAAVAEELSRRW